MCKCTPSIRTPYCGKFGCTWAEDTTDYVNQDRIKRIATATEGIAQYKDTPIYNTLKLRNFLCLLMANEGFSRQGVEMVDHLEEQMCMLLNIKNKNTNEIHRGTI